MGVSEVPLLILLLLTSAFFSGTEAAFFALSRVQLRRLERDKKGTSRRILEVLSRPSYFLTSVLIGNTLVNVAMTVLTTSLFVRWLGESAGIQVSILVTTAVVLIVGELTPKTLAVNFPEPMSRASVHAVRGLQVFLGPLIGAVTFLSDAVLRLIGFERGGLQPNARFSRAELDSLLEGADREGIMTARESWLAQNILEFSSTRAEEVMTPRIDMSAAPSAMERDELEAFVRQARHSRVPIYGDTIDEITGYLPTREFLLHPESNPLELVRPVAIFPERAYVSQVFYEMQKSRAPISVVVNEYGETVGMLTQEDLLEELIGEIYDESEAGEEPLRRLGRGLYSAEGQHNVTELNEALNLNLPEDSALTLNGFLSGLIGGIPPVGEVIEHEGIRFRVCEASRLRILRVEIRIPEDEPIVDRREWPRLVPGPAGSSDKNPSRREASDG